MAARSQARFLKDAPGDEQCDLDKEIAQRMTSFADVFKERLMKPLVHLFDAGDYTGAEGEPRAGGFQRLSVLVMELQPARAIEGRTLGQLAQDLLDAERARQRDFLAQPVPLPRPLALAKLQRWEGETVDVSGQPYPVIRRITPCRTHHARGADARGRRFHRRFMPTRA